MIEISAPTGSVEECETRPEETAAASCAPLTRADPASNEATGVKRQRKRRELEPIRYDAEGNEILSSAEVARRIGIKPGTLRKWRLAGRGPDPIKKHDPMKEQGKRFAPAFYFADEYDRWAQDNLNYRDELKA